MRGRSPRNSSRAPRIYKNQDIKAFNILVIGVDGENIGVISRAKALAMAEELGLDLVQISYNPKEQISTAKIVDFGKRQYDKKKVESEKKKNQKQKGQKEVKFGYKIGDHDLDMKLKKGVEFLEDGYVLRIAVVLKGREKIYKELAREKMIRAEEYFKEVGKPQSIKGEHFGFSLVVLPKK